MNEHSRTQQMFLNGELRFILSKEKNETEIFLGIIRFCYI